MKKIFVYGTLMRGFGNHYLITDSTQLGKGFTINKYLMTASFIPYVSSVETEDSDYILGEIYEIDEDILRRVDMLEGHPSFYKREEIDVRMDDGSVEKCWIYFNNNDTGSILIDNGNYFQYRMALQNMTRKVEV